MDNEIRVSAPKIIYNDHTATMKCDVYGDKMPRSLWFEIPKEFASQVSVHRPDWIYTSLLMPAMIRGAGLVVDAPISEKLHYSLSGDLQYILGKQDKRLKHVAIVAQSLLGNEESSIGQAVGMGFSAGIDSFCSIIDNTAEGLPPPHKLTHLTLLNVGAMGTGDEGSLLFQKYSERLKEYSTYSGFDCLSINSNLADFYEESFSFQQTHTIRNASAILVLQGLFRRYYYASTFEYTNTFIGPTYDMSYADPLILSMLGTEQLEFVSSGSRYSRLEKVIKVASFPDSYKYLDVCVGNRKTRLSGKFPNCSSCWKCGRQLFTLELLGRLLDYDKVFDLAQYRASRTYLLAAILKSAYYAHQPNDLDVIDLARKSRKMYLFNDKFNGFLIRRAPRKMSRLMAKLIVFLSSKPIG